MKKKIILGTSDAWLIDESFDPVAQQIILKIVGFLVVVEYPPIYIYVVLLLM